MTGVKPSTPAPEDGLTAARARAAELGVSVSEYVRDQLWRTRGEEAWERALAEAAAGEAAAGEVLPPAQPGPAQPRSAPDQPGFPG
ncbi:hypothetical protein [Catenulispora sp. GP43]|uniref:hypothetical protein n=1 Tax=Catenulispora sp. GP43 TaxID=3156263 RepID=UPI003519154E